MSWECALDLGMGARSTRHWWCNTASCDGSSRNLFITASCVDDLQHPHYVVAVTPGQPPPPDMQQTSRGPPLKACRVDAAAIVRTQIAPTARIPAAGAGALPTV